MPADFRLRTLDVDPDTLQVRAFDEKKLKYLLEFVYGVRDGGKLTNKRIRETRDLSRLAQVLQSKRATTVLESGGSLEQAGLFIDSRQESLNRLRRLVNELKVLLKAVLAKQLSQKAVEVVLTRFASFEKSVKQFLKNVKKSKV